MSNLPSDDEIMPDLTVPKLRGQAWPTSARGPNFTNLSSEAKFDLPKLRGQTWPTWAKRSNLAYPS